MCHLQVPGVSLCPQALLACLRLFAGLVTSNVDVLSNSGHGWFGEKDFQIEKVLFFGPLPPGPTTKIFTPDILCENIEFKISF